MRSGFRLRGLWYLALAAILLLPPAGSVCADDKEEDIDYICEKEREKIESAYRAAKEECDAYAERYSIERLKQDPAVMQAAHDSTVAKSFEEARKWPRPNTPSSTQPADESGFTFTITFGTPQEASSPADPMLPEEDLYGEQHIEPWKDPRFDYDRHYQRYLQRIAESISKSRQEQVRLAGLEAGQWYEQALARLEYECQRRRDLHQEFLREDAERKDRERRENALRKRITHEKEVIGAKKSINRGDIGIDSGIEGFLAAMEEEPPGPASVIIRPGRFDPDRRRWGEVSRRVRFKPWEPPDSLKAVIESIEKSGG